MRLFEGATDNGRNGLVFLAPARGTVPPLGWRVRRDDRQYARVLHGLQRLRGQVYLEDGAIREAQLISDGRHWQPSDATSWHLVAIDERGNVFGCARYSHYESEVGFQDLGVRTSALAESERWGSLLRTAVEGEAARAAGLGLAFAEVGGWAISAEKRYTTEALRVALATYALAQMLGGCIGITTATVRHHSAQILRRIGGRPLSVNQQDLPPYYDPQYQCQMEVLRFDSARPDTAYHRAIERLREQLLSVTVVAPECAPALSYPAAAQVPITTPKPVLWPVAS
ncbi:MAG: hypothetical protein JST11_21780 [Acidobacteria bacterium]|nr:hypothetical protein [Acidobacteriota bacterium]